MTSNHVISFAIRSTKIPIFVDRMAKLDFLKYSHDYWPSGNKMKRLHFKVVEKILVQTIEIASYVINFNYSSQAAAFRRCVGFQLDLTLLFRYKQTLLSRNSFARRKSEVIKIK